MVAMFLINPFGLLVLGAVAATILWKCRHPGTNNSACRGRGWWLVPFVALLLATYYFAGVRIERRSSERSHAAARQMAAVQHNVALQHAKIARQAAEINAEIHHQIANMDIHALMDQADSPRIAIPPDPPAAPDASAEAPSTGEPSETHEESTANEEAESHGEADGAPEGGVAADEAQSGDAASATENAEQTTAESAEAAAHEAADDSDAADDPTRAPISSPTTQPVGPPRPAWIDDSPKRVGNTWRDLIATDEFATREECDREADRLLRRAAFEHLQALVGKIENGGMPRIVPVEIIHDTVTSDEDRSAAGHLNAMGITIDYIRREIAKDEYLETVERSFGPMKKLHTLVEFTPAVDRDLRARWDNFQRQERFEIVGLGAASVLSLLGLAWGLLKVDTITKGYYSKRLFLGVPAAIIGGFWLLLLIR